MNLSVVVLKQLKGLVSLLCANSGGVFSFALGSMVGWLVGWLLVGWLAVIRL